MAQGGDGSGPGLGLDMCRRETEDTSLSLVVWDVQSCPLSKDLNLEAAEIFPRIKHKLSEWGYSGPVKMVAIGRPSLFSKQTATDLTNTGVLIKHPTSKKRSGTDFLFVMIPWLMDNRPPANFLLIAGDRDNFSDSIESLGQDNYNILLRKQECTKTERENHLSYCWSWSELFDGRRPQGN